METKLLNKGDVLIFGMHVVTITRVTERRAYADQWPIFYRDPVKDKDGSIRFREYGRGDRFSFGYPPQSGELERIAAEKAHFVDAGHLANEIGMTRFHQLTREKLEAIKKIINS